MKTPSKIIFLQCKNISLAKIPKVFSNIELFFDMSNKLTLNLSYLSPTKEETIVEYSNNF